jgi:hypothetical protein
MPVLTLWGVAPRNRSSDQSFGCHSGMSKMPSQTTGVRRPSWRKLSSGARSILCLHASNHGYQEQCSSDNRDVLHTQLLSDVSFASSQSGGETLLCSTSGSAALIQTQKKLHTRNRVGTIAKLPPVTPPRDIKEIHQPLMGPISRGGNDGGRGNSSGPEVGSPIRIQALERATWDRERSFGSREGADGRGAWEAMKRRILYIEEHGSLPDDDGGGGSADVTRDDAERILREHRARRRKGWAEESIKSIRRKARKDDATKTAAAVKKRRRNGGCWTCENGVLMRLVSSRFPLSQICSSYICVFTRVLQHARRSESSSHL